MQNKIENLHERLKTLKDIIGEINFEDITKKQESSSIFREKVSSISDIIHKLHKEIIDNDTVTVKEIHKRFEELNPFLNVEKLSSEFTIGEDEMYVLISANFDEIESFLGNVNFIKDNQKKILDHDPIIDLPEKRKIIREKEFSSIDINNKVYQLHNNIDNLAQTYYDSINIINEKFGVYNKILDALEVLNK